MLVASKGKINPNVIGSAVDNFVFGGGAAFNSSPSDGFKEDLPAPGTTDAGSSPLKSRVASR